jgi:hypothetical protein
MKLSILFYGKKKVRTSDHSLPIYLRVTINGIRFETTANRFVDRSKWSPQAGRVKGNTEEARRINLFLDQLRQKAYEIERAIISEGKLLSIASFREKWETGEEKPRMLIPIFEEHNEEMRKLIGRDFSKGTHTCYKTTLLHTQAFLLWKFKRPDVDIRKFNYQFITDFEFWLKSEKHCDHNTAMKCKFCSC